MRKLLIAAAAALVAIACLVPAASASASLRSKNKVDHYKHYRTCSTCPRSVIDYGPDGKLNNRFWEAAAVNPYGEYVFYVWERGRIYYQGGRCTSKPDWSSDASVYKQTWNRWHVEGKNPVSGSGPYIDAQHPAYRYRRVMYHMVADTPWWTFRRDKYVGMTLRCDGTWAPAG